MPSAMRSCRSKKAGCWRASFPAAVSSSSTAKTICRLPTSRNGRACSTRCKNFSLSRPPTPLPPARCRCMNSPRASATFSMASPRVWTTRRSPLRSDCRRKPFATTLHGYSTKFGVEHRYQAIVRAREAGLGTEKTRAAALIGTFVPTMPPACRRPGPSPQDINRPWPQAQGVSCVVHARAAEPEDNAMPKFVIERDIVGAGKLPKPELQAISQKSCSVLHGMGPKIQWVQSYVTDDKIYCVYIAPDEETVKMPCPQGRLSGQRGRPRAIGDRSDNGGMITSLPAIARRDATLPDRRRSRSRRETSRATFAHKPACACRWRFSAG